MNKTLVIRIFSDLSIKYNWFSYLDKSYITSKLRTCNKLITISPQGHVKIYGQSRSLGPLGRGPNAEELREQAAREAYFSYSPTAAELKMAHHNRAHYSEPMD